MRKRTLIPGVHWPIPPGLREADARSPGRSCRASDTLSSRWVVQTWAELDGVGFFFFFCFSWNGWEMGLEVWGDEVNKEESVK